MAGIRTEQTTPENWLQSALFSSRKGRGSICPRSAERLLKMAVVKVGLQPITFRAVAQLGKRLSNPDSSFRASRGGIRGSELAEEAEGLARQIRWFFNQTFRNVDDRREAEQETKARLCVMLAATHVPAELQKLTLKIARSIHRSVMRAKERKPEIQFEHFDFVADTDAVDRLASRDEVDELNGFVSDALGSITDTEAELVRMVVMEEYPLAKAARLVGISAHRARVIKDQAVVKLSAKYARRR